MEHICELLFEVSNDDRLGILSRLEREAMNITGLARDLGITTQEASRHSARLLDSGLTRKDADGRIHLTPYGRLTLELLPGLEFVSRHREYFTAHTLAELPPELRSRIGELADCGYSGDVMLTIYNIEKVIREAEEYLLNISSHYPASVVPPLQEALERGVKIRSIDQRDKAPHPTMIDIYRDEGWLRVIRTARAEGRSVDRLLERMPVNLWMSEREVGIVSFCKEDGGFDFLGFSSEDEGARMWCRDLFEFFWEKAEPGYRILPPSP
jgi:predicted transcriptional regulator